MTGPHPAVAATRVAVRDAVRDLDAATPVGVALSGGVDSLALLAATRFVRDGLVAALVVDQGWHEGSAAAAQRAARLAHALGAAPVEVLSAPAPRGEAPAREARYGALEEAAHRLGLAALLVGHTRDDQAETVLLGLARGSGGRSLAGMASVRGVIRRPLLDLPRTTTLAACRALTLTPIEDPANDDPAFLRNRVRSQALPSLVSTLGQDVTVNLVRTARLLRDDADALDSWAEVSATTVCASDGSFDCAALALLPAAVRRRILLSRTPATTCAHVDALDALVTSWHGQGPVSLPGGVLAARRSGKIHVSPPREAG